MKLCNSCNLRPARAGYCHPCHGFRSNVSHLQKVLYKPEWTRRDYIVLATRASRLQYFEEKGLTYPREEWLARRKQGKSILKGK